MMYAKIVHAFTLLQRMKARAMTPRVRRMGS